MERQMKGWVFVTSQTSAGMDAGGAPYVDKKGRARLWRPYLPSGVDELARRRRSLLVASGGPWNRYDFPG